MSQPILSRRLAPALAGALASFAGFSSDAGILPNGISVGDVDVSSAVLWARTPGASNITFEWSQDAEFGQLAGAVSVAQRDGLVPAKAFITGLEPGSTYHVRTLVDGAPSGATALFRTPRQPGSGGGPGLRFGVTGDWRGELSPYPAVTNAAQRDLDFFVKLGDTIYADYASPAVPLDQATSPWEFRLKHEEVYSERFGLNAWADLQATTAIFSMIDDHEVTNDFEGGASPASNPLFAAAVAVAESPIVVDSKEGGFADSDDPAIWVNPSDPAQSVIVGVKKNGGLSVFTLDGTVIQEVNPPEIRYNNVDHVSGFPLGGVPTDIFVVSDRANDLLVVFAIDPITRLLSDVTDPAMGRIFPDVDVKEQETAYGVACARDAVRGTTTAFISRRSRAQVVQLELVDNGGVVGWTLQRTIDLPDTFDGWSPENPQVEGMVTDLENGVVFMGQEQVGIWMAEIDPDSVVPPVLMDRVREFGGSEGGGDHISADVEGLTIYPTGPGSGLLLASSQGDNTFAVYSREAPHAFLGSFTVTGSGDIDGVEECDGAEAVAVPLGPGFPMGALVVQDGNGLPAVLVEDDGEFENGATNFKIVPWESVHAALFEQPKYVNQTGLYDTGLQTFHEWNAIAEETWTGTGDDRMDGRPRLYRSRFFGADAAVMLLDARSFRDEGLPAVTDPTDPAQAAAFLLASFDPSRTMLGSAQKAQLKADLLTAQQVGATWKFIVVPEPVQNLGLAAASDRFEGYAAERTEILDFVVQNGITNVVFIAADIHGTLVNNLTYQVAPFGPQIPTGMFEVTTGSVAFDAPFGPTVAQLAAGLGLLSPGQYEIYQSLPPVIQDQVVGALVDLVTAPFGYDPLGLEGSPIDAELLSGAYTAVHWFGWTEFEIDGFSKDLLVTTWGIESYTEEQLLEDPEAIVARTPTILGQFVVHPVLPPCAGDLDGSGAVDGADLGTLLAAWGAGPGSPADLNGDGTVGGEDLGLLLSGWGGPCG